LIAIALACNPSLLIADEPTTALDVTISAQIIDLFKQLQKQLGTSLLLITHDLSVVSSLCDQVLVMYAGKIVEEGPVDQVLSSPRHPYTQMLLQATARLDRSRSEKLIHQRQADARRRRCRFFFNPTWRNFGAGRRKWLWKINLRAHARAA
jgi:ABC-type dipeptide/oligopeptide/nickel transport system ATPase component